MRASGNPSATHARKSSPHQRSHTRRRIPVSIADRRDRAHRRERSPPALKALAAFSNRPRRCRTLSWTSCDRRRALQALVGRSQTTARTRSSIDFGMAMIIPPPAVDRAVVRRVQTRVGGSCEMIGSG